MINVGDMFLFDDMFLLGNVNVVIGIIDHGFEVTVLVLGHKGVHHLHTTRNNMLHPDFLLTRGVQIKLQN